MDRIPAAKLAPPTEPNEIRLCDCGYRIIWTDSRRGSYWIHLIPGAPECPKLGAR